LLLVREFIPCYFQSATVNREIVLILFDIGFFDSVIKVIRAENSEVFGFSVAVDTAHCGY